MNGDIFSLEQLLIGRLNNAELTTIELGQDPDELDEHIYHELAHS